MLTDPAICSACEGGEGTFGHTDLGPRGVLSFFRNHQCGIYCYALGISDCRPEIPAGFEPCPGGRSTSYFSTSVLSQNFSNQGFGGGSDLTLVSNLTQTLPPSVTTRSLALTAGVSQLRKWKPSLEAFSSEDSDESW